MEKHEIKQDQTKLEIDSPIKYIQVNRLYLLSQYWTHKPNDHLLEFLMSELLGLLILRILFFPLFP